MRVSKIVSYCNSLYEKEYIEINLFTMNMERHTFTRYNRNDTNRNGKSTQMAQKVNER